MNKVRGLRLLNFKAYYKATLIYTGWYWLIYTHIDQWNKTESPEKRLYIYIQLMFDKGANTIHWGKRIVFKINGGGASLVAQWLGVRLPMQGTRFVPWSGRIPHAAERLGP